MEPIRLATEDEIKAIADHADLASAASVVAFGTGDTAVLAVLRNAFEIDPMISGDKVTTQRKAFFIWGLENALRMQGIKQYYFNVLADDEKYRGIVESWGATAVSTAPEIRYKKVL